MEHIQAFNCVGRLRILEEWLPEIDAASLREAVTWAVSRIKELEAIRDKQPKTADGVRCIGGERVWSDSKYGLDCFIVICEARIIYNELMAYWRAQRIDEDGHLDPYMFASMECCYSSREAAKASKENEDG